MVKCIIIIIIQRKIAKDITIIIKRKNIINTINYQFRFESDITRSFSVYKANFEFHLTTY
jgi:hypothetical protein